jgi:hypothetical protein
VLGKKSGFGLQQVNRKHNSSQYELILNINNGKNKERKYMLEQHLIPTYKKQTASKIKRMLQMSYTTFIAIASVSPSRKRISLRNHLYLTKLHGFIDIEDSIRLICLLRSYTGSKRSHKVIQAKDKRLCTQHIHNIKQVNYNNFYNLSIYQCSFLLLPYFRDLEGSLQEAP